MQKYKLQNYSTALAKSVLGVVLFLASSVGASAGGELSAPQKSTVYSSVISSSIGGESADFSAGEGRDFGFQLDDEGYAFIQGDAHVNIPVGVKYSLQFDLGGLATFTDRNEGEDNLQTYYYTAAHLAYRNPHSHAVGVFGLAGSVNGGENENALIGLVGLEAQKYIRNVTLYGQFGFFVADDETENDVMTDAWFIRGVARYFPSQNARFQAEISYADGEENDATESELTALSWGVRYDRQLANSSYPISWFIAYDGYKGEENEEGNNELVTHAGRIGLTFRFGTDSLIENDRRGATFDTPDVGRWTGWTMETLD